MKKLMIATSLLAAAALAVTPLAFALGPDCDGRGPHHGKRFSRGGPDGPHGFDGRMLRMLDLTEEQETQLKALRDGHREAVRPLREQMRANREQVRALMEAETPDKEAILAKMAEVDTVRSQMRAMQLEQRLAVRNLLTPEQLQTLQEKREKFREFQEEFGNKRGRGHGRRHGRHSGPPLGDES